MAERRWWRGETPAYPVIVVHLQDKYGLAKCSGATIIPVGDQFNKVPRVPCAGCTRPSSLESS